MKEFEQNAVFAVEACADGGETNSNAQAGGAEASTETRPEPEQQAAGLEAVFASASSVADQSDPTLSSEEAALKSLLEAIIYVTDEPLTPIQIAKALDRPLEQIKRLLHLLLEEYSRPERGIFIREVAGGYSMGTKPEHHEEIRKFVKSVKNSLKLSPAALETLACIAYKQPITAPEIQEIRGVQGTGVLKTLLDRKLITTAGRKNVVGRPILYKTTKEFLKEFGLKDLSELPTLKEFEELNRIAIADAESEAPEQLSLDEAQSAGEDLSASVASRIDTAAPETAVAPEELPEVEASGVDGGPAEAGDEQKRVAAVEPSPEQDAGDVSGGEPYKEHP